MWWFLLWFSLIAATIVGGYFLGRRLWRSGKALLEQLRESQQVLAQLQTRISELEALPRPVEPFQPAVWADADQQEQWRTLRRKHADDRRARRHNRRSATFRRWRRLGLPG